MRERWIHWSPPTPLRSPLRIALHSISPALRFPSTPFQGPSAGRFAESNAIDVSSVHWPGRNRNSPPPTVSSNGVNVPGRRNSSVVPRESPAARRAGSRGSGSVAQPSSLPIEAHVCADANGERMNGILDSGHAAGERTVGVLLREPQLWAPSSSKSIMDRRSATRTAITARLHPTSTWTGPRFR